MYEAQTCSVCDALIYYPDEVVIGHYEPKANPEERGEDFIVCDKVHDKDDKVYCLECAPCECGDHERLVAHTAENITKAVM
jgi:hypothetical protein